MARRNKPRHVGFKALSTKVTREYERKGYSASRARRIGNATAGKIARRKGK
jgi:hypothetical protein